MKFIQPNWPAPSCVKAYTTTRQGWDGNVNNNSLKELLALPTSPIWLTQNHGVNCVEAIHENINRIADASFSFMHNQICIVKTADCLPILICNKEGTTVAAIHAGWRGLAAGVIEKTLAVLNLNPNSTLVWLGPAIGPNQFEVGPDVYDAFTVPYPQTKTAF